MCADTKGTGAGIIRSRTTGVLAPKEPVPQLQMWAVLVSRKKRARSTPPALPNKTQTPSCAALARSCRPWIIARPRSSMALVEIRGFTSIFTNPQ